MDFRCPYCGAHLHVAPGEIPDGRCPRCGASLASRPPASWARGAFRRSHASLKRVYEPIPRPVVYLAGAGLALLLTSPFWIYVFRERLSREAPIIVDESGDIRMTGSTNATPSPVPLLAEREGGAVALDRFRGVWLESGREEMQRRFNLRLQNTRGMMPEIYEAERVGEIEQITAYFYGNALKECLLLMRERHETPDEVQRQLVEQFGEPQQVEEAENKTAALGMGLPSLSGGHPDLTQQYSKRRDLIWADEQNQVEAAIYYHTPGMPSSMLSVRLSAASWLKANRPLVNPAAPAATNALDRPLLPVQTLR